MKVAIATNNKNKLREIRAILGGFFEEALSLDDLGIHTRERPHQGAHHTRYDGIARPRRRQRAHG